VQYADIDEEIEKLRSKKVEITNRINMSRDFDEKEDLLLQVSAIQKQIDALERFKKK
jgi:hypothetical protein